MVFRIQIAGVASTHYDVDNDQLSEFSARYSPLLPPPGMDSIRGPAAHLGYFRTECVGRRGWLSDTTYADLVAMSQFLPGPASSKVGMALGYGRAGLSGMAYS